MRVASQRQRLVFGAMQTDTRDVSTPQRQFVEFRFQPKPCRDKDLVVAAASRMHPAANVAEALGQARLDCRMAVLVTRVEDESPIVEIHCERVKISYKRRSIGGIQHADTRETFDVRLARGD